MSEIMMQNTEAEQLAEQIRNLHKLVSVARRLIGRLDDFSLGQAAVAWGNEGMSGLKAQSTREDRDYFTAGLEDYMRKYGAGWTNSAPDIRRFGRLAQQHTGLTHKEAT